MARELIDKVRGYCMRQLKKCAEFDAKHPDMLGTDEAGHFFNVGYRVAHENMVKYLNNPAVNCEIYKDE